MSKEEGAVEISIEGNPYTGTFLEYVGPRTVTLYCCDNVLSGPLIDDINLKWEFDLTTPWSINP